MKVEHTIPEIEWDTKAINYADPIGMCNSLIEELHELGDMLEPLDDNDFDKDFIEGMVAAYTNVLTRLGVVNIPVIGDNC